MGALAAEEIKKRLAIRKKVDSLIESVSEKIQSNDMSPGEYAATVKALAELIAARATLT